LSFRWPRRALYKMGECFNWGDRHYGSWLRDKVPRYGCDCAKIGPQVANDLVVLFLDFSARHGPGVSGGFECQPDGEVVRLLVVRLRAGQLHVKAQAGRRRLGIRLSIRAFAAAGAGPGAGDGPRRRGLAARTKPDVRHARLRHCRIDDLTPQVLYERA